MPSSRGSPHPGILCLLHCRQILHHQRRLGSPEAKGPVKAPLSLWFCDFLDFANMPTGGDRFLMFTRRDTLLISSRNLIMIGCRDYPLFPTRT